MGQCKNRVELGHTTSRSTGSPINPAPGDLCVRRLEVTWQSRSVNSMGG